MKELKKKYEETIVTEKIMTGSQLLLEIFLNEGIRTIFGYPGGAIMPVYDALYDYQEKLEHILVRHEQGAIHAAQGYARASGNVGVVIATSGPGATNLVTGLADALLDSTPVVCITGQVYAHLLGSDAFQEIDVMGITTPVTKWNYQITDANQIPEILAKAFYIARSGRPGPVVIDITKNAQLQRLPYPGYKPCIGLPNYKPVPVPDKTQLIKAAMLINEAKRPFVIIGQGVLLGKAETELLQFIEKTGIPTAWTILGMSAIPTDHPLAVGMVGMHGNYGPNLLTNECDVLIAIGMRFDDRVTGRLDEYATKAKIIHLDIDRAEIDKNVKADIPILGDCKETLPQLTRLVLSKTHQKWYNYFKDCQETEYKEVIQNEIYPAGNRITMGEVIRNINELTEGEAIIVSDVGQHQMITCRYAHYKNSRSNITSGGLGTMGFAIPAAIGAATAYTNRSVIAVMGDGGVQMNIQELGTIMQFKINVKLIILNNSFLGMVRQWQELFHDNRYSFVAMHNPDFVKIAAGYSIPGQRVERREDLHQALQHMMEHKGSYLLEIVVGKEDNVFPMVPQGKSVSDIVFNKDQI
ncbi:biosynthetic-type acetolactate synthase large subunit [Flavobacterium cerinum]|uniref:Acetolactate synthase n=1 Tax=Flavobacterium cerinum TaxID=2502784 RepID=A0ABY5IQM8_9FLAO|nr:biosynthetic-type acetolactate synthase large subunit [Flavobacterium cerinum]UUC44939.1 biosynthetic-type acetolactate synthase large subunit [Flavobacterium cerinum]